MAKRTKKLGEGQEMDFEQLKKNYAQDFGPCDCGSEDFEFTATGKKMLGLPVLRAKCKNCGEEWNLMGILDNKVKRGQITIIDKDTEAVIKMMEDFAVSSPDPDEPFFFVPDGVHGAVSPRMLLDEMRRGTPFGEGWLNSLVETYRENNLSKIVLHLKKGRKMTAASVIAPIITNPEELTRHILEHWKKTIGEENVKKYQGKYVGILNENEIVASGDNPDEIMEEVKKKNLTVFFNNLVFNNLVLTNFSYIMRH